MALLLQEKINDHASWALWQITEPEEVLLKMLQPSPTERNELALIKNGTRRLEWLATRLLIKQLALARQIMPTKVLKDANGKPYLAGEEAFISLSHSFPFAAAIINTEKAVGIDIEKSREQLNRISHKFLNQEELSCAGTSLEKLCVYWTAKETLYKVYGKRGLILQDNILISPFELAEKGVLEGQLITKEVKQSYTLHYHQFKDLHICYSL